MRQVDVLIARLRLVSGARRNALGELPADPGLWWQQMQTTAEALGLELTWEDYQLVVRHEAERRSQ